MRSTLGLLLVLSILSVTASLAAGEHVSSGELRWVLPRDAIPAVRTPTFATEPTVSDDELVIGLEIGGDARAYPVKILNHHEIVDDLVGGVPVAVTFCPLCNSAIVFDRRVGEQVLTFGVSGFLFKSNLVMYDEETESLWVQFTSEAVQGPLHGTNLTVLPSTVIEWGAWRGQHAASLLLDYPAPVCDPMEPVGEPTLIGSCIDYNVHPYGAYILNEDLYFGASYDDRILHPKAVVLGVSVGGVAMAYSFESLAEEIVINDEVNGVKIVVAFHESSAKAFERGALTFQTNGEGFMVDGLGREWDMVTGETDGGRLEEVPSTVAFWFAWAQFQEGTGVYGIRDPASEGSFPLAYIISVAVIVPIISLYIYRRRMRMR